MNVLRSLRFLVGLGVPLRLPGGQQVYVSFKHPPQGIQHLGLVGFEEVPITNPTIAALLRRAIIFVRRRKKKVSRDPKSSWRLRTEGSLYMRSRLV